MKKIIYISLSILFLIASCISNKDITKRINSLPGISNELFMVLDTLKQKNVAYDNDSLLRVIFFYEEENCYLIIAPTSYYNEDKVIGYFKHNNWYVFIDSSDCKCYYDHIVPGDLLKEEIPSSFLKQSELGDKIVDPYGMKFQVFSDSIKFVYKGFF